MKHDKPNRNSANSQRMIPGRSLAENMGYRLLNLAVVFIINILLSRLAGVSGYGLLSLLIANATIFNLLSAFGADAGITFHAASGKFSPGKLLFFLLMTLLFQSAAVTITEVVAYSITGNFFLFKTNELQYWWVGATFMISISIIEKYTALLYGQQQFIRCSKLLLLSNGLMLALFAVLYLVFEERAALFYIGAFVLLTLLQAVFLACSYHSLPGNSFKPIVVTRNDLKTFFSYSVFALLINIIQFLAYRVDYWLLDHYKGEAQLGWYSLAVRLSQLFWVLPLLFASILFPAVAGKIQTYSEDKMHSLIRGMNFLNLIAAILCFLLVPIALPYLFGQDYESSILLFQILLPGVVFFCIATLLAAYNAGSKKLSINFFGSLLCLIVILLLDLLWIPAKGMKGAAMASSIGYGITAFYFIIVYCTGNKVSLSKLFIPRQEDWIYLRNIFRKD